MSGRKTIDISQVKLMAYDEADEIFLQESNQKSIKCINNAFEKVKVKPQFVLFSATFNESVIECINKFFEKMEAFTIEKEALKLKGVKMYKMRVEQLMKIDTIKEVYEVFDVFQTMIFCNKKKDAETLQSKIKQQGIQAEKLIGGIEQAERDSIID